MFFGIGKVWKWSVISAVLRNVLYPSKCYVHRNPIDF